MYRTLFAAIFVAAISADFTAGSEPQGEPTKVVVVVGRSTNVACEKPISFVEVVLPTVGRATIQQGQIVVIDGLTVGQTSVSLWLQDEKLPSTYLVTVTPPITDLQKRIQEIFGKELQSLQLDYVAETQKLIVNGSIKNLHDAEEVLQMLEGPYIPRKNIISRLKLIPPPAQPQCCCCCRR